MAMAFFLWPDNNHTTTPGETQQPPPPLAFNFNPSPAESSHNLLQPPPSPSVPVSTTQTVKSKARKTSAKPPAKNRPPQRGLGVAKLENLRLQDRWNKITTPNNTSSAIDDLFYNNNCSSNFAAGGESNINCFAPGSWGIPTGTSCYNGGGGGGGFRSVLQDSYEMDRLRVSGIQQTPMMLMTGTAEATGGGIQSITQQFRELSSNQIIQQIVNGGQSTKAVKARTQPLPSTSLLQCIPEDCEFCLRNKLLQLTDANGFEAVDGKDYCISTIDLNAAAAIEPQEMKPKISTFMEEKIMEYEFFPQNATADLVEDHGEQKVTFARPSFSPAAPVDLTLKLSL